MTASVHPIRPAQPIRVSEPLDVQGDLGLAALTREPNLYQQAGYLVRVVRVDPSSATPERPDGTPEVRRVETDTIRELMAKHAAWERFDKSRQEYVPCHPPRDVASAIRRRGEFPGIRPLDAIIEAPSLRPDGSLLSQPGYDPATRVLFMPDREWPRVRDEPQLEHARKALAALTELFEEIPFTKPAEHYVPVAAILSLYARSAIRGAVPAFAFDSSVAGSGKSLCANVIGAIYTGRWSEPNTYPRDDVELEKSLGAEAISGAPIVDFGNVEGLVESGPLLKALTAKDKVRLRVLGLTCKVSMRWRAVVILGGNNLVIGRQMSRRTILARIEPREERPEEREGFKIPDLARHALEQRTRLGVAALTILRAFFCAGCPSSGVKPVGSYEEWSAIVPAAIVWAGGLDVTKCRSASTSASEDTETRALRVLLPRLATLAGPDGITAGTLLRTLYPTGARPKNDAPPDGYDEVREALEELCASRNGTVPTSHALGTRMRALRGRWVAGKRLINREDESKHRVARWAVETS